MNKHLVVNTHSSQGNVVRREIWDTAKPFGLGFPFRWVLEKSETGIRVWNINEHQVEEIPEGKICNFLHKLGQDFSISITQDRREVVGTSWQSKQIDPEFLDTSNEVSLFKRAVTGSLGGLTLFLLASVVISTYFKPKEEALIPAQFAKVILTPPAKSGASGNRQTAQNDSAKGPRAVNIVQAFKSTEVQKSTQKLLKGGIISLLAKSNFLPDKKSRAVVSAMFDAGSNRKPATSLSQLADLKSVAISGLGGQGQAGGKGNSVGYGNGEKAGIQGQGNSFVALNTFDAIVEEGLTKDEVGKVIHSHLAEVRYCYESAMIKNPSVEGKLISDFIINGSGIVKTAKVNMSNVNDVSLDQCIIGHLAKWKFPKPRGGIDVAVVYPFIFKSLGK